MRVDPEKIRLELARKEWTQQQLANKADVHGRTLWNVIKLGSATPRTVGKIARALGVDVEEIM